MYKRQFQGSLKNCIGGIMIMILHPFRVGDYIIESTYNSEGTVSEITVFYTKLATMDNKTIILPNGCLLYTSCFAPFPAYSVCVW